ncbi:alpha/beta hydrolase [Streptomyces sp. NPDC020096]
MSAKATIPGNGIRGGRLRSADGSRIAYLKAGEGPVIIFLHASMGTGTDWAAAAQRLTSSQRVVFVDRRGHGASDWGVGRYAIEREVEDLLALLDHFGPATVVAHSFGATVALEAALVAGRGRIERLALFEPPLPVAGPLAADVLPGCLEAIDAGEYEPALIAALAAVDLLPRNIDVLRGGLTDWAPLVREAPAFVRELAAVNALAPGVDRFRALDLPTLLLSGEYSPAHLRFTGRALAEALSTPLHTLGGCGHSAPIFAAAEVAAKIDEFIRLAGPVENPVSLVLDQSAVSGE